MDSEAVARLIRDRFEAVPPRGLLVVSDFDGTISEIVDEPAKARLVPEAVGAIQRLVPRVLRVVVVSGRSGEFLRSQIPFAGVVLRGNYGQSGVTGEERLRLDRFNHEAGNRIRAWAAVWLEPKPASTSIHFRNQPDAGGDLHQRLSPLADSLDLVISRGRMVLEVTLPRADKGRTLNQLVTEMQPDGVVFAGDDTGDLTAFEQMSLLPVPHLTVGVASPEVSPATFEACDLVLNCPRAVAAFLGCLADWAA
ncbi:MAG TPA: trehalose-phosphatase [Candidatus Dormibacteraeota bacterium]|nr:trehalose-phosphatase [Candidatus Dormibacteraeota bacterium]